MSGTLSGIGSALQGATSLAAYVLGNNTTSNSSTSGTTSSNQHADTSVTDTINTSSDVKTASTSSTDTSTSAFSNTVASADPGVIATLKALASSAIANSTDPTKTQGLIASVLQQAGDAMTQIFGLQKQSGIYNSASAANQNNDIMSRAAADAATAVLGYKTSEQQIAGSALQNLLAATATSSTTSGSDSHSTTNTSSDSLTTTQNQETANTVVNSNASAQTLSTTQSKSKSGMSVVCTWMVNNNKLSLRRYYIVSSDFNQKNRFKKYGYLTIAQPMVRILEANHTTRLAAAILWLFTNRTEYVCCEYGLKHTRKTWKGFVSVGVVAALSTPAGLWMWLCEKLRKESKVLPADLR